MAFKLLEQALLDTGNIKYLVYQKIKKFIGLKL